MSRPRDIDMTATLVVLVCTVCTLLAALVLAMLTHGSGWDLS